MTNELIFNYIYFDVFNLVHRLYQKDEDVKLNTNAVVDYILDSKSKLYADGKIYLLFDPLPHYDMGLSKKFRTERREISETYKANRAKNPEIVKIAALVKNYFDHRGDVFYTVISSKFEADDFVKPLIALHKGENKEARIALVSTDYDWCRYVKDSIVFMKEGVKGKPFTKSDFFEKFQYMPSESVTILKKALVTGDGSDNVKGVFANSKNFFYGDPKDVLNNFFNSWDPERSIGSFCQEFFSKSTYGISQKEKTDDMDALYTILASADHKKKESDCIGQLRDNIRIFDCIFQEDIKRYIIHRSYDKYQSDYVDIYLGRKKKVEENKPFRIGFDIHR